MCRLVDFIKFRRINSTNIEDGPDPFVNSAVGNLLRDCSLCRLINGNCILVILVELGTSDIPDRSRYTDSSQDREDGKNNYELNKSKAAASASVP